MKKRNRAYYRHQRNRNIQRKLYIFQIIWGIKDGKVIQGKYSKGKVHCSCRMCKFEKHYDIQKDKYKSKMKDMEKEICSYLDEEDI